MLTDERNETAAAFWTRAQYLLHKRRNHRPTRAHRHRSCFRARTWPPRSPVPRSHRTHPPYRLQTNRQVERFNRTLSTNGPTPAPTPQNPTSSHLPRLTPHPQPPPRPHARHGPPPAAYPTSPD